MICVFVKGNRKKSEEMEGMMPFNTGFSTDESSDEDSFTVRAPLCNQRSNFIPLPRIKINDEDYMESRRGSSENSIEDIHTYSGVFTDKLAMTFPSIMPKRKPREYKLKGFVAILFFTITFLLGFAYIHYQKQESMKGAFFDGFHFYYTNGTFYLHNGNESELLTGYLGLSIDDVPSYHCLPPDQLEHYTVCREWKNKYRIHFGYNSANGVHCYNIMWISLSESITPVSCFSIPEEQGHWYGGGEDFNMTWTLDQTLKPISPFLQRNDYVKTRGDAFRKFFMSTKGVALKVADDKSLYVSANVSDKQLCLMSKFYHFMYPEHRGLLSSLNYSVCVSSDLRALLFHFNPKLRLNKDKLHQLEIVDLLVREPMWQFPPTKKDQFTEDALLDYSNKVLSLSFFKQGYILISELWQANSGDFVADLERFPHLKTLISKLCDKGLKTVLKLSPFVSIESVNFHDLLRDGMFITGIYRNISEVVTYETRLSGGILDITNNNTNLWIQERLKILESEFNIRNFFLDLETLYNLPLVYKLTQRITLDLHNVLLIQNISEMYNVIGVSSVTFKPLPIFVSLPSFSSSWVSLKQIVPIVLTYGLNGFPLTMSGPIGGTTSNDSLPDRELYVRWLQLATFLPVMQFMYLPNMYDERVVQIAAYCINIRNSVVNPILDAHLRTAVETGLPIIHPLWMLDPDDDECQTINDEFTIAGELLVAPILSPDIVERDIYLPRGVWKDGIDGIERKGPLWIRRYIVNQDKIAFFKNVYDDISA